MKIYTMPTYLDIEYYYAMSMTVQKHVPEYTLYVCHLNTYMCHLS